MAFTVTFEITDQPNFSFVITPYFMPRYETVMSPNGERDKTDQILDIQGFLTGTDVSTQFARLANITISARPISVVIKEDNIERLRWDRANFIGSPVARNLKVLTSGGMFVNHLVFTLEIHAIRGSTKLDGSYLTTDVSRVITDEVYNLRLRQRVQRIMAKGPNAEARVRALKPLGQLPLREHYTIDQDNNVFIANWEYDPLQRPAEGIVRHEEQITVSDGGAPIVHTLITGAQSLPVLRRGRNTPGLIVAEGFIRSILKNIPIPTDFGQFLVDNRFLDRTRSNLRSPSFLFDPLHAIFQRQYREVYVVPIGVGDLSTRVIPQPVAGQPRPGAGVRIP